MSRLLLRRLVDDDQWETEDLAGRLGIVAHAAFLRAGFVPYGDEPNFGYLLKVVDEIGPSAPSLSRRYTAAQLASLEGGDAAVLELRARGNGDVAFQAYLVTRDGNRGILSCEAVLDEATLAPLLPGDLAEVERALETGSAGSCIWRPLADWVLPVLLLELCRRNDLPVTSFMSLPDDAKLEVLKRLTDGKDLAMVECTSSELRDLVKKRDGELWKAMYESLGLPIEVQSSHEAGSWKERYLNSRTRLPQLESWWGLPSFLLDADDGGERYLDMLTEYRRQSEAELQHFWEDWEFEFHLPTQYHFITEPVDFTGFSYPSYMVHDYPPAPPPEREVPARGSKNAVWQSRKAQRNDYQKKRHGAGAIHAPSSRYRWKHR